MEQTAFLIRKGVSRGIQGNAGQHRVPLAVGIVDIDAGRRVRCEGHAQQPLFPTPGTHAVGEVHPQMPFSRGEVHTDNLSPSFQHVSPVGMVGVSDKLCGLVKPPGNRGELELWNEDNSEEEPHGLLWRNKMLRKAVVEQFNRLLIACSGALKKIIDHNVPNIISESNPGFFFLINITSMGMCPPIMGANGNQRIQLALPLPIVQLVEGPIIPIIGGYIEL
jgi:hypothetical protein